MSGERIDIEVQDKVSPAVRDKILGIATAARTADRALDKLKRQLAAIDATGVEKLSNASAKLTNALAREMNAQARLTTATLRQATEDGKAALAKQKLATEAARTAAAEARLAAEVSRASNASVQAASAATRYETALLRLKAAQDKAAAGNSNIAKSGAGASGGLASLAQNAISAAGSYIGGREILQAADAYTTLENKLRTVTDSSRQLAAVQTELFKIANETRAPVADTATSFQRFDMAMKELGASQRETLDLTKTLNQAIQLSGATTSEAQSGMIQLAQAFGSGKLQGDEFRSIMENLPVVADILAKRLKVTRGELKDMATDGKITAEVMRAAFADARVEIGEKFAKSVPTLAQSMSVLNNNFVAYVGQVDKATGATSLLSQGVLGIANNMNIAAPAMAALGIVAISFSSSIVGGFGAATAAVRTFTIALLTNPVGILIVAVTAAVALLYTFRDSLFVAGDGVTTLGDLFRALWEITVETFNSMWAAAQAFFTPLMELAKPVIETVQGWFKGFGENVDLTFRGIVTFVARYYDTIIGIGVGSVKAMIAAWGAFPGAFADLILRAVNAGIKLMEDFVNGAIALLNKLIGAFNAIGDNELTRKLGINFTALNDIAQVSFGKIENTYAGGFERLGTSTRDAFLEGFNGSNGLVGAVNKVFDRAAAIGQNRLETARETARANARLGDPLRGAGKAAKKASEDDDGKATKAAEKRAAALSKINRELDSEIARMGMLTPQREIQQQLDQYENYLLSKKIKLTADEKAALKAKLEQIQNLELVQQQLDTIYSETLGKETELRAATMATAEAYKLGLISADAYGSRLVKLQSQIAQVKLEAGNGSFADVLSASLGKVVESYKGILAGLSDSFGTFFTSLNQGFGDAIGNAITKGENLGDALRSVAQQAVSKLISSLVQLGVQYVLTQALGVGMATTTGAAQVASAGAATAAQVAGAATSTAAQVAGTATVTAANAAQTAAAVAGTATQTATAVAGTATQTAAAVTGAATTAAAQVAATGVATTAAVAGMATTTTASVASATATGAAWAPAAAFASIGSFGTAALLGLAGIAAVIALVSKGFEKGGYTGGGGRKAIAGVVHGKEFVMNADATAKNRRLLEAMNSGYDVAGLVPGYMTGGYVEPAYSGQRTQQPPASNEGRSNRNSKEKASNGVTVNLNLTTKDANSFVASEGQVAAAAARAIQRGTRNL